MNISERNLIRYRMQEQGMQSVLTLENQKKLTLTGVESVESFSDTAIVLTVGGKKATICGQKLKILAFSQGNGNFSACGEVNSLKFGGAKKLSKLFK